MINAQARKVLGKPLLLEISISPEAQWDHISLNNLGFCIILGIILIVLLNRREGNSSHCKHTFLSPIEAFSSKRKFLHCTPFFISFENLWHIGIIITARSISIQNNSLTISAFRFTSHLESGCWLHVDTGSHFIWQLASE